MAQILRVFGLLACEGTHRIDEGTHGIDDRTRLGDEGTRVLRSNPSGQVAAGREAFWFVYKVLMAPVSPRRKYSRMARPLQAKATDQPGTHP